MKALKIINKGTPELIMKRKIESEVLSKQSTESTWETTKYSLEPVTEEELLAHRASGKPGYVLKLGDKLYYTEILKHWKFDYSYKANEHCCGKHGACERLSAAEDCNGGCKKVRDYFSRWYVTEGKVSEQVLRKIKRIEKYPFITWGYEIFNTKSEVLVVLDCINYK